MNLSSLTISDLKHLEKLLARKEALLRQVRTLDQQLESYGSAAQPAAKAVVRRGRRKKIKEAIVAMLKKAGKDGLTVKQICGQLGLKPNRIYTWFYGTGKKFKEIKKIGEARYRWEA